MRILTIYEIFLINLSDVGDGCPLCNIRETMFHCFKECERIKPLSEILEALFTAVGEMFNNTV